jgi:hypothetical protein
MFWKTNASGKAARKVDVRGLQADLRAKVDGEVRFDRGTRALYATDGSNYRQAPIGVVIPRHRDAVIAAVEVCRDYGAPILSRGCGTSLCGQTCNVAVVIDHSKYRHHILEIDPDRKALHLAEFLLLAYEKSGTELKAGRESGREVLQHLHVNT